MKPTPNNDNTISNTQLLRRVLGLARPHKWLFAAAALLAITLAPLGILRPKLVEYITDHYVLKYDFGGLILMLALLLVLLLLEVGLQYLFSYMTSYLGQSIIRDLRVRVFDHINHLSLSYFDKTPVGRNITRTTSDVETLNATFSQGMIAIIADLLSIVFVLIAMFYTSWKLTAVTLLLLPFLFVATYFFKEGTKKSFEKVRTQVANMNTFLQERISGMRIVQIFNVEQQELRRFKQINQDYTRANIEGIFYYAVFFPIVEILVAASLGIMVWFGAKGVLDGSVSLGAMVSFPMLVNMLYRPVRVIADKFNTLQMGLIASARIFETLDNSDHTPNHGRLTPSRIAGDVSFSHVDFKYNDEQPNLILNDVSFSLPAGETLAIVGSTGSGKTTIISLLNRFYDIQSGEIYIDGKPIRDYELSALRRRIAVVLQDVFLFSGTVLDNIRLRDTSISRQEVEEAARLIGADEFIRKLPGGYDYEVQERGATLSMGQRQLISFVRALVSNPDILILDEATSSVDPQTEAVIQYAIEKLIEKRTSIIIAHRLSTIRHARHLLVMDKGKVAEFDTPANLLAKPDGVFRRLHDAQLSNNSLAATEADVLT